MGKLYYVYFVTDPSIYHSC